MQKVLKWYERDIHCATVVYEGSWPTAVLIEYQKLVEDPLSLPLHWEPAEELNALFESRLEPRANFSALSREYYGIDHYDAEKMCRARHGTMPVDTFWMKFESDPEDLCWDDVCVQ